MKTIISFIKSIFKGKKADNVINSSNQTEQAANPRTLPISDNTNRNITTLNNVDKAQDDILNVTSKSVGHNTIEMTIELNDAAFLKKLMDGTLGSGKRETSIEAVTGFYGSTQYSPNKHFCVSYAEGHYNNDKWKNGNIALVKDNKVLFKKKLQRPNNCFVSNDGIVICCD